jgi:hypothetical protein
MSCVPADRDRYDPDFRHPMRGKVVGAIVVVLGPNSPVSLRRDWAFAKRHPKKQSLPKRFVLAER